MRTQITKTTYDEAPAGLTFSQSNLRKRVSAVALDEDGDGVDESASYYSYDILGNARSIWQYQAAMERALVGQGLKRLDYDFDLVSGKVNKVYYQPGQADQFIYRYFYDADNRLISAFTSRDNLIWHTDATYQYYLHGPRARTELGTHKVQGIDYAYTLQGWLKGINGASLDAASDIGGDGDAGTLHSTVARDAMTYVLGYNSNDYSPIGGVASTAFNGAYNTPATLSTGNGLYNGNINFTMFSLSRLSGGQPCRRKSVGNGQPELSLPERH